MNIMISINRAYMGYACVMLLSLKEHHKNIPLNVYILHNELNDEDFLEMDRIIGSDGISLIPLHIPIGTVKDFQIGNWPEVAAFRLLAADLFDDSVERILHLDVDILITGNITELYNTPFDENYLVACEDFLTADVMQRKNRENCRPDNMKFFNSGILLFNLNKLRNDGIFYSFYQEVLHKYTNLKIEYPDQDVLNLVFGHKVKYADRIKYNYMPFFFKNNDMEHFYDTPKELEQNCCILHMATGNTPWKGIYKMAANELWWEYARKTPFYHEMKLTHIFNMLFMKQEIEKLNNSKLQKDVCNLHSDELAEYIEDLLYTQLQHLLSFSDTIDKL